HLRHQPELGIDRIRTDVDRLRYEQPREEPRDQVDDERDIRIRRCCAPEPEAEYHVVDRRLHQRLQYVPEQAQIMVRIFTFDVQDQALLFFRFFTFDVV